MRILVQTSGGGGAVLVVVVALLAGGRGGSAGVALLAVLIALAIVVALALAALIVFAVHRTRSGRPAVTYSAGPAGEARQMLAGAAPNLALQAPAQHVHFHGVSAEEVAEILRRHKAEQ